MTFDWILITRLVGGIIGVEREFRAKEAGVRTHFIVALGSALFMIISQYAFGDKPHDVSRVAAQVVSGIGFIGAGVIIFQRNVIRGVTTAAGLWVAAAIGMAAGDGMYSVAIAATVLTLGCLEMMHFINMQVGEKVVDITLLPPDGYDPLQLPMKLKEMHINLENFAVSDGRIRLSLRFRSKNVLDRLKVLMDNLEGFTIQEIN